MSISIFGALVLLLGPFLSRSGVLRAQTLLLVLGGTSALTLTALGGTIWGGFETGLVWNCANTLNNCTDWGGSPVTSQPRPVALRSVPPVAHRRGRHRPPAW